MYPRSVPYESSPQPRDNIVTVGMPGVTSTRSQMARYTGGDPVTVLCNWADNPRDPLHELEMYNNRYTGMSFGNRVRRVVRLWNTIVWRCKGKEVDADVADNDGDFHAAEGRGEAASSNQQMEAVAVDSQVPFRAVNGAASLSRRGKLGSSSPPSFSENEPPATLPRPPHDVAVEEADKGLIDPPVLYNATCRVAPRLLHGVLASPEVSESRHRHWYRTLNPLHWALILKELLTGWWFCTRPFQFCYSEPGRTNMGGLRDQALYRREVRRAIHKMEASAAAPETKRKHLVLFGVSRGATTCFYTAMKLGPEEAKHVSLVLVEAPFDTLEHVINASSALPRLLRWFFCAFCDWRGARDEAAAYDFDTHAVHLRCPVAFVLSTKDRRVPNECTQALIDRVRRELVPHVIPAVEVLTLQHSRHPCMAVGHKDDQDAYVAFVEDLYNRYCPP
jgi:dienelactone hydrolase